MKLILRADVENLGNLGDVVTVKPGYGRNFLLPQGLAMVASEANMKAFELERKKLQERMDALRADAQALCAKLEALEVVIPMHVGDNDKLYGSVTSSIIGDALAALGVDVDRRRILMDAPIRTLGDHPVRVRLHASIVATVPVKVVSDHPVVEEEAQPEAEAEAPAAEAEAAEHVAEYIAQIAEVEARRAVAPSGAACARPVAGVNAREAELVVPGLFLRVGQHLVGLVDLLELLLGLLVTGVHVRVVLSGQLFICFFDLVLAGALADAEDLIIISFFLCHGINLLLPVLLPAEPTPSAKRWILRPADGRPTTAYRVYVEEV